MDDLNKITDGQRKIMLRSILEDRFHIKVHSDTKIFPAYEMVVAKGGPKLKPFVAQKDDTVAKAGSTMTVGANGLHEFKGVGVPLHSVIAGVANGVQRRVIDKTGLTGIYTFSLKWASELASPTNPIGDAEGPSIFTALQEQLGLKLQSTSAPFEFLVVDHVEMPSAN